MSTPVDQNPIDNDDALTFDDLPCLDTNSLTQSELLSLCRTSKSYFDPESQNDVVIPPINRAVFNESAGSRRQTYTRVRLLHRAPKPRCPAPLIDSKNIIPDCVDRIFGEKSKPRVKGFMGSENVGPGKGFDGGEVGANPSEDLVSVQSSVLQSLLGGGGGMIIGENVVVEKKENVGGSKEKRKRMVMHNGGGVELKRVNKKGDMVDFDYLETNGDRLFAEELRKRIVGLETAERVLGVLESLDGQWCSSRKKRKFVESSELGDALPIGWEVVVGIVKRGSFVSLCCKEFVSPTGLQFVSCKEAAIFLRSHFVLNDAKHSMSERDVSMTYDTTPPSNDVASRMTCNVEANKVPVSVSDLQVNGTLVGMDNLVEVQVKYRRHISEGIIIRDGKYECQICHKIFDERRKYNGHVGVHVRKGHKKSLTQVELTSTTGTVNSSIDIDKKSSVKMKVEFVDRIAGSSYMTRSNNGFANVTSQQLKSGSNSIEPVHLSVNASTDIDKASSVRMKVEFVDKLDGKSYMTSSGNAFANVTSEKLKPGSNSIEPIHPRFGSKFVRALDQELTHHDFKGRIESEEVTMVDDLNAKSVKKFTCPETDDMKCRTGEHKAGYSQKASESGSVVYDIGQPDVLHNEIATSSEFFMQSFECLPEFASGSAKGDYEFFKPDPKCQNVTGFDELGPDDLEALGYSFPEGQDSASLPGPSFDLANDSEMKTGVNSDRLSISNMDGGHLLTTSCVWCQSEFQIQTNNAETRSDTIGYMCPTCKDNIPGLS
ncbi:hypothetical protein Leryth_013564 [Lithospermum erythrorhizon]|nr:hypothetical protein Leryth_013564 [Lithospermum erythrorhizon]